MGWTVVLKVEGYEQLQKILGLAEASTVQQGITVLSLTNESVPEHFPPKPGSVEKASSFKQFTAGYAPPVSDVVEEKTPTPSPSLFKPQPVKPVPPSTPRVTTQDRHAARINGDCLTRFSRRRMSVQMLQYFHSCKTLGKNQIFVTELQGAMKAAGFDPQSASPWLSMATRLGLVVRLEPGVYALKGEESVE